MKSVPLIGKVSVVGTGAASASVCMQSSVGVVTDSRKRYPTA
jgi:hypothetical protein